MRFLPGGRVRITVLAAVVIGLAGRRDRLRLDPGWQQGLSRLLQDEHWQFRVIDTELGRSLQCQRDGDHVEPDRADRGIRAEGPSGPSGERGPSDAWLGPASDATTLTPFATPGNSADLVSVTVPAGNFVLTGNVWALDSTGTVFVRCHFSEFCTHLRPRRRRIGAE